ncbi:TM0106 family RecB-like putative nuclease [Glutamicibacter nicotianae]|uniref:ATPase n=1 Tax=Glutamicibacter nicotianae TaxID=37929 RepID=A0ABQ0RN10_GLUNI|nr:bifunctional RecB family nuclease/DEAD/DEAH box helicase [Glutamicibacter nicotianae]GEC13206.1 ATPase [Glutamicibacter nicotianae]
MFFLDDQFIFSASDLSVSVDCNYQSLYLLDVKLGLRPKPDMARDEMLERTAVLGDAHEQNVLKELIATYGDYDPQTGTGVKQFADRPQMTPAGLRAAHEATMDVLRNGADVIFQATFFDGAFLGFADFLVRQPDGTWAVWDTKLARHARVSALLQIAAYADQMLAEDIPVSTSATLVLGDGTHSVHRVDEVLPVFRAQRERFLAMVHKHRAKNQPVEWNSDELRLCGRCDYCEEQAQASRDLLLVAGMSMVQREKLRARGITTIDQLAGLDAEPRTALQRVTDQAKMQLGLATADGSAHGVSYRVKNAGPISSLPRPDQGDIFFDFEGDPLYQDPSDGSWGLEYLFGVVEYDTGAPVFKPFWAHSRAEERQAFLDFIAYVEERRQRYPQMKVYHYAPYEKTALRKLSQVHIAGEDEVDQWLRENLLVDLYETVRNALVVSTRSYSIKKLEPLYMGEHLRSGDVTDAGASVVAYAQYMLARDTENEDAAASILASIADYNEYDCLSTLRLRDWLLTLIDQAPGTLQDTPEPPAAGEEYEPTPEELRLQDYLAQLPHGQALSDDDRAIAMVAAATGYNRREKKQFWWEHFDRLSAPMDDWSDVRGVFIVNSAEVLEDWHKATERARTYTRVTKLQGTLAEGSLLSPGSSVFAMFDAPLPEGMAVDDSVRGGAFNATVVELGEGWITIAEKSSGKIPAYGALPCALAPDKPLATVSIDAALTEIAQQVGATVPVLPQRPGIDILRRIPPRLKTLSAPVEPELVDGQAQVYPAVVQTLKDLDNSYLAVQGPPGTGKTFVASHVIRELIDYGWKIGVVAQSHAVVENVLRKAVEAGVDPEVVAKEVKHKDPVPWTGTSKESVAEVLDAPGGALIGGTAWTLTGSKVPAGSLDLLVIDEAGQFSLANTLAVSRAARNLLLLGDPQQLPQVTQGTHPQPVDESALGWLSGGEPVLPAELGYFLAASWRMHPALCAKVSALSYDHQLFSADAAGLRVLEGTEAGVETVFVEHRGNTVSSVEEAEAIVRLVREHLGMLWSPGSGKPARPLAADDILVVAAYNAQVNLVREVLEAEGLPDVRVGTVDKFQGQEAPVVLVTMACSSAADASRGIEFLLNRNRINVAISRGQWKAVIVRSERLTDYLPSNPSTLSQLGAFMAL